MTIARDARIGSGYIAREGDTGAVVWAAARDAKAVSKGALRTTLPARPGQIVFSDIEGVKAPNAAINDNAWIQSFDFLITNGGHVAVSTPPRGVWSLGVGWVSILTGGNTELRIERTPVTLITTVRVVTATYDCTTQPDACTFGGSVLTAFIPSGVGANKVLSWTGSITPTDLRFDLVDLLASGSITLKALVVSGNGVNPYTGL